MTSTATTPAFEATPFAPGGGAPLLAGGAWWGALAVVGVALALGWLIIPARSQWGRGVGGFVDLWLGRAAAGLAVTALAVLGLGQARGLLFRFPWWLPALAGWGALAASAARALRNGRQGDGGRGKIDYDCDYEHEHDYGNDNDNEKSISRPPAFGFRPTALVLRLLGWAAAGFVLLLLLLPAVCPPLNYDVLEYHLGIVPHIFAARRVEPIPHVFYTAQPIATEMLYTLAAAVEGTPWGQAPGMLQWFLVALGVLLLARLLVRLRAPRPWRPWLIVLLLVHPIAVRLELDRLTDWTGLVMLAAGLNVWLAAWEAGGNGARAGGASAIPWRAGLLMGLLAGGAVGAKWTHAGTVALPLLLCAFGLGLRRIGGGGVRARLRGGMLAAAACGLAAAVAWLPWGVWLWHVRRNPFAPFLADYFPNPQWGPPQLAFLIQAHGPLAFGSGAYWANLGRRLTIGFPGTPLIEAALLVAGGVWLAVAIRWLIRGNPAISHAPGRVTPLRGRLDDDLALLGWLGGGILAAVLLWGRLRFAADRFLAPMLVAALVTTALGLKWLIFRWVPSRRVAYRSAAVLGVATLAALLAMPGLLDLTALVRAVRYAPRAFGRVSVRDFWSENLGLTVRLFEAADALPAGSRILAVSEARRYPFSRPVDPASVFDASPILPYLRAVVPAPASIDDAAEDLRRLLAAAGYTHLLVNEYERNRLLAMHTPPRVANNPRFRKTLRIPNEAQRQHELAGRWMWSYMDFASERLSDPQRNV
ncbi:MAG: hypothetical protein M1457_01965, partial [bacterium]|nr:hypothetical protein [bacterium]